MSCSICKSSSEIPVYQETLEALEWELFGKPYGYVKCSSCGFMQCNPIPSHIDLLRFYQEQYPYSWFKKNEWYKRVQSKHRFFKIKSHLADGKKNLDFGCGHGFFVQVLAENGYQSFGFDIGAEKISHHHNGNITNKNNLKQFEESDFDTITLWHVLEHMYDHHTIISQLKEKLKHNGKMIIAVPNANSFGLKKLGTKWGWLQQPFVHINMYNPENLSMLLQTHGFKIVSVTTSDTWDQSLYDFLISKFFYKNKSRNTIRDFSESNGGKIFFRTNQIARLLFAPVSYLFSFIRKSKLEGSELIIIAKNQAS
jgi:SAM-dependent methyltransferase